MAFATIALAFTSCGDDVTNINNTYNIENVEVFLSAKSLITETESPFGAKGVSFDNSYTHQLPTSYKAYFVADETKGQYVQHQVVQVIDVVSGMNSITVPKMKVKVYVTNYDHPNYDETQPNAWYTWNDAKQQLPQTSHTLNLHGFNSIDYGVETVGEVTVTNPYSAVMIKNNQWVSSAPSSYDTNQNYTLVAMDEWYLLYIRNNNTNTKIPISIAGNPNQHYTLSKAIQANKIYQYTINGNVLEDDGNLNIITVPLEEGTAEEINL